MLCPRGKGEDAHDDHTTPCDVEILYFFGATLCGLVVNCASALIHELAGPHIVGLFLSMCPR